MLETINGLSLYDWIESVALLVSLSGVLILTACSVTRTLDRLTKIGKRLAWRDSGDAPLMAAVGRRGMSHLACGGLLFVIAETMEFIVY